MTARRLAVNARFDTPLARGRGFRQQHGPVAAELRRFGFVAEIRDDDDFAFRALPQALEMMRPHGALPLEVDGYLGVLARHEDAARIVHDVTVVVFVPGGAGNRSQ